MDNPVYYVQYAHARVRAVHRRAEERGLNTNGPADPALLREEEELDLLRLFDRFPQVAEDAARNHAPHYISYYLMDIAGQVHRCCRPPGASCGQRGTLNCPPAPSGGSRCRH